MLRGRDAELAQLSAMVDTIVFTRSGVAVVEGMAGIGKTALLDEVARLGLAAGCGVAAGGADELDQISPMGGLLGALRSGQPPLLTPGDLEGLQATETTGGARYTNSLRVGLPPRNSTDSSPVHIH